MRKYNVRRDGRKVFCHWQDRHQTRWMTRPPTGLVGDVSNAGFDCDESGGSDYLGLLIIMDVNPGCAACPDMTLMFCEEFMSIADQSFRQLRGDVIDAWIRGWTAHQLSSMSAATMPADPPMTEGGI